MTLIPKAALCQASREYHIPLAVANWGGRNVQEQLEAIELSRLSKEHDDSITYNLHPADLLDMP